MDVETDRQLSDAECLSSHGLGFYREVGRALQADQTWSALATDFDYSIVHECMGPATAIFLLRFEGGDLMEAVGLSSEEERPSDLLLRASVETWGRIFANEVQFLTAFMLGAVKVAGLRPELGRHVWAFHHLLRVTQSVTARRMVRASAPRS